MGCQQGQSPSGAHSPHLTSHLSRFPTWPWCPALGLCEPLTCLPASSRGKPAAGLSPQWGPRAPLIPRSRRPNGGATTVQPGGAEAALARAAGAGGRRCLAHIQGRAKSLARSATRLQSECVFLPPLQSSGKGDADKWTLTGFRYEFFRPAD